MDLDPLANSQMAKEMRERIIELDNAITLMRTLRDEMDELFFELFGDSQEG